MILLNLRVSSIFGLPFKMYYNKNNYTLQVRLQNYYCTKKFDSIIDSRGSKCFSLSHLYYFQNHLLLSWNMHIFDISKNCFRGRLLLISYFNTVSVLNYFSCTICKPIFVQLCIYAHKVHH